MMMALTDHYLWTEHQSLCFSYFTCFYLVPKLILYNALIAPMCM